MPGCGLNRTYTTPLPGVVVERLTAPVTLGEGPHWDAERQCLFFVSIFDRSIHKYDPASGRHTSAQLDAMPTFIIPVEGSRELFAVSQGRQAAVVRWDGEDGPAEVVRRLATVDQDHPGNRFNDAKCDPRGRLFAGTMGEEYEPGQFRPKAGSLFRLDSAGAPARVECDLDISNGLCWDEAAGAFYFADSFEYDVRKYDYDVDTGEISHPKLIFSYLERGVPGIPDGMTIDTDGNLWIANFDGSQVLKVDPRTGSLLLKVPIPALQTTSVTWGGAQLDELYVTTACMHRGAEQLPPAGSLFRVRGLGARGRAGVPVRLDPGLLS